jgi:hypothetical protein
MPPTVNDTTILSTLDGPLGDSFEGASWDNWRTILKAAYGMPLTDNELGFFYQLAGDREPPSKHSTLTTSAATTMFFAAPCSV